MRMLTADENDDLFLMNFSAYAPTIWALPFPKSWLHHCVMHVITGEQSLFMLSSSHYYIMSTAYLYQTISKKYNLLEVYRSKSTALY